MIMAALFASSACSERDHAPAATVSASSRDRNALAPSAPQLNSTTAFELVASSQGALLAWAPGPCSEGIFVQRYAPDGEALGTPSQLDGCGPIANTHAGIVQLSAVADGGKLGLAWIVRTNEEAHVLGSFAADTATAFAPTLLLGAAAPGMLPGRSRLSMAGADNGQMRVSWRAPEGPCSNGSGTCARVLTSSHPPSEPVAARGSDAREVPMPCPELLVGALWRNNVWYESFCALEPDAEGTQAQPMTEVYAIRPEIFYAEAFPVLAGCTPLGVAPGPRGVLLQGMCADGLRVHALGEANRDVMTSAVREVRCDAGRPSLEIRNGQGQSITYRLDAPTDRIELWLTGKLATSESRVAFTGRKLLVATPKGNKLELHAWKCQGESLVSDSPAML
jgi:hypothetical protein